MSIHVALLNSIV